MKLDQVYKGQWVRITKPGKQYGRTGEIYAMNFNGNDTIIFVDLGDYCRIIPCFLNEIEEAGVESAPVAAGAE